MAKTKVEVSGTPVDTVVSEGTGITVITSNGHSDEEVFTFELPEKVKDCPPPSTTKAWKLELPDGEHYFMVRGGGTQREARYLSWATEQLQKASKRHSLKEIDDEAYQRAAILYNARFATFVADRVVDHNIVNEDGEKAPLGMALFFEFNATDALALAWRIQRKQSIWHDPKAEKPSTTG